jgi:hypothetical protein
MLRGPALFHATALLGGESNTFSVDGRELKIRDQEWAGEHWKTSTLKDIGLVYQLGHEGLACPVPHPFVRSLTVLHTTGVQRIRYQFCGCDRSDKANNLAQLMRNTWYPASFTDPDTCATFAVLDFFRLLNVIGNVNARDFVTSLERLTDATAGTGLKWLPVRPFLRLFLVVSL